MASQSIGDNYNIRCPHCSKTNHYVAHGIIIDAHKVVCFKKPCLSCGKMVYYQGQYEIKIVAYLEDPLRELKPFCDN